MRVVLPLALGSVLFAAVGCSSASPSGASRASAPGGSGGVTASETGTTDPGTRVFGADPVGAISVETLPSVKAGAPGTTAPVWNEGGSSVVGDAAPRHVPSGRSTPPPPPPPPPDVRPRIPPPPPEPTSSIVELAPAPNWPETPYPAGSGAPPMPPGLRTASGILGPPPAGELPPPRTRQLPR